MSEINPPAEQDLPEGRLTARRDHLLGEIKRSNKRDRRLHKVNERHLLVAACFVIVSLITGLLSLAAFDAKSNPQSPDGPSQDPSFVLIKSTEAIDNAVDVVLHARETRWSIDSTQPDKQIEGWADRAQVGNGRLRFLSTNGTPIVDSGSLSKDGKIQRRDVVYESRTVHESSSGNAITVDPQLPNKDLRLVGPEVLDGIDTVHLAGSTQDSQIETWVSTSTHLPVRSTKTTSTIRSLIEYEWIPRTVDNLAVLVPPVPTGFAFSEAPFVPSPQEQSELTTTTTIQINSPQTQATVAQQVGSATTVTTPTPTTTTLVRPTTTTTTTIPVKYQTTDHPPPESTLYENDHGIQCEIRHLSGNIYTQACAAVLYDQANDQVTGAGDVSVYRLENGQRLPAPGFGVRPVITAILINGNTADQRHCACGPEQYSSNSSRNVSPGSTKFSTAQAVITYEVYESANLIASYDLKSAPFQVTA